MAEDRFSIEKLQPIGNSLWTATFIVRTPETISGVDVRQAAELRIRFEYDQNSSVSGLMETAYAKVRECLRSAIDYVEGNSLSDAQAEQQEWRDALNAPLILNLDDLDEATQRVLLDGLEGSASG